PLNRRQRVFDDVVKQPGRNGDDVQLHVGQEIGDGKWVDEIWFARVTHLSAVLERGEDVGPAKELHVGVRAVGPDLFQQVLEANHENWCLNRMLTYVFLLHYTDPVSATAILLA